MKPAMMANGTKKIVISWTIVLIPVTMLPKSTPKELPRRAFHRHSSPKSNSICQVWSMCRK